MVAKEQFNGYDPGFLGDAIPLPKLSKQHLSDLFRFNDKHDGVIPYFNYSIVLSGSHKFPFLTASNIDGALFKKIARQDRWRKDLRIGKAQWGRELYLIKGSKFDRGHMVKREDVQWGNGEADAYKGADSTFFYSNAVPQHKNLNRKIWKSLENYILNTETKKKDLKVSVFTGPVLSTSNPIFFQSVGGQQVQLPVLFWKIVFFKKADGNMYRVAFMMSQKSLLEKDGLTEQLESAIVDDELFLLFKEANTYQINVKTIEEITGLNFSKAKEPYTDNRPIKLIISDIDVESELESFSSSSEIPLKIENIVL